MTLEECTKRIADLQKAIPELQTQLQQLLGYKQALLDIQESQSVEMEGNDEPQH